MSRPVKDARRAKTPKGTAPNDKTMKAFGGKESSKYGTTPIGPNIEQASKPRFDGPTVILNRWNYPDNG